jgi:hypothetical protein
MAGKLHSFLRHAVKVRGLDDVLPVATKITISKIIGKNVDDVWLPRRKRKRKSKN